MSRFARAAESLTLPRVAGADDVYAAPTRIKSLPPDLLAAMREQRNPTPRSAPALLDGEYVVEEEYDTTILANIESDSHRARLDRVAWTVLLVAGVLVFGAVAELEIMVVR